MGDIETWLKEHGFGDYAQTFLVQRIELADLPELTDADLRELGLPMGPRKRFLRAALTLGDDSLETSGQEVPRVATSPSGKAERRHLTVMFSDLVGSTALSESMDPEELREVIGAYQSAAKQAIEPYEGYIARYMGDGLLIYFGYPHAHEEDPERAVRAALDVVDAVGASGAGRGVALRVRIGIATGLVVAGDIIGEGSAQERAVLGDTPNLAARLQALAGPDEVLVTESTMRLIRGRFDLVARGAHALKGIAKPVEVFQATGVRETTRFAAAHGAGLERLLGRDEELGMLTRRWELASEGEGQVVLLGGEPGIGKSRLAEAIRLRAREEHHAQITFQCSPYHVHSAFYPVVTQIERAATFERRDTEEHKLDKLEALFGEAADGLWLVATLMSLPTDRYVTAALTPEKRKTETISILVRHLASLARTSPVLVILEDAHWIDHSTRELFDALTDDVARMRVLLVITHRPEFESQWSAKRHATQIALSGLSRRDVGSLVRSLAGDVALPDEIVLEILHKTDGIPLYVEELTKDVLESGQAREGSPGALELRIPSTIQDSLVARLDRLGEAKQIAQAGATVGRQFSYPLLAAAWGGEEDALRRGLEQLEAAGLVRSRGRPPDASYSFKHALVRDAAYGTLLHERRRALHCRIASALRQHYCGEIETQPELLAHHLTEANDTDAALEQWLLAGRLAFGRSAAPEAEAHLERGRSLIALHSQADERLSTELAFCVALGPVYMTTKGAHAQETEQIYARARELSEKVGDEKVRFKAIWGQWHVKQVGGDLDGAIPLADECLSLSGQMQDEDCELQAHHAGWSTQFFRGEFVSCLDHAERGWALYDEGRHADHRFAYGGHDPGACGRYFSGLSHWFLGRPDASERCASQALAVARSIHHPFSLVVTLLYTAYGTYFRREHCQTRVLAGEGVRVCEELGFPTWLPGLAQLADWASLVEDADAGVLGQMEGRISPERVAGQLLPSNVAFLADACVRLGERERGLAAVDRGFELARALGQRWIVAELHRLRARLVTLDGSERSSEAESELKASLAVARQQRARGIELRAATDLARLHAGAGDSRGARELLQPVYDAFREGFDTLDLADARTLLAEID